MSESVLSIMTQSWLWDSKIKDKTDFVIFQKTILLYFAIVVFDIEKTPENNKLATLEKPEFLRNKFSLHSANHGGRGRLGNIWNFSQVYFLVFYKKQNVICVIGFGQKKPWNCQGIISAVSETLEKSGHVINLSCKSGINEVIPWEVPQTLCLSSPL